MVNSLKSGHLPQKILIHFLCASLFFPMFSSSSGSVFSPDLILVNLFAVFYIALMVFQKKITLCGNRLLFAAITLCLLGFNLCAFYANRMHLSWYEGQLNVSISFLFFLTLLLTEASEEREDLLKCFLKLIVISNALGLIPYFLNNYGISIMNGTVYRIAMEGQFDERRYSWFYPHKSDYAFMLVLFLALMVRFRNRFPKKWMLWCSIGILAFGLILSNTRATIAASLFLFLGWILDEIRQKPRKVKMRYALLVIPLLLLMAFLVYLVSQRRDLLTLGSRTYIWAASLEEIRRNPWGLGTQIGFQTFPIPVWPKNVYNCHNVFLNILLQFSIPAGCFYILMLGILILASIRRKPTFLTLGIWVALLIPMNMDWCLQLQQMSVFLLAVYFLFFYRDANPPLASAEKTSRI